jgi:hypothetical protein
MDAQTEAAFERKAEQHFKGHRGLLPGRDFRWNCFRFRDEDDQFRSRFDRTFPDAPGSPGWWEWKFRDF